MSSDTTKALLQTAYDRIMAYVDNAGGTLATYVGAGSAARLFIRLTPDAVQYPYVVLRASLADVDPECGNLRSVVRFEARCVHRSEDGTVEQMADLIEEALLTWVESSPTLGLTFGQSSTRESREPEPETANRDLAETTVIVTCVSWMKRLTAIIA